MASVKSKGRLILVPTPIEEEGRLEPRAFESLLLAATEKREESLFVVEDIRPGRRRWIRFGLPREVIEDLYSYSEHSRDKLKFELLAQMKKGKTVYLMSDGGVPAFCDPGRELVDLCWREGVAVDSFPLFNSVVMALSLSGLRHESFLFLGFPPVKKEEREVWMKNKALSKETLIMMDTPYRLKKMALEVGSFFKERTVFVALDLCRETQFLWRGSVKEFSRKEWGKKEFILVISDS